MTVEELRLTIGGVWIVVFGAVFLANVVGSHLGRRRRGSGLDAAQMGTVQGGLLAFSACCWPSASRRPPADSPIARN